MKNKIGFIGQGWIGSNYADVFEERGFNVVRYDLTPKYKMNKNKIKDCEFVFIAVPTASTRRPWESYVDVDDSIIESVIRECTKKDQIIIIKSTIMVGTTNKMQKLFPDRYIVHSPELLTEATAKYDAANPSMNLVGYTDKSKKVANKVLRILTCAPYEEIATAEHTEMVKYMINCWFYMKVLTINMFYDVAKAKGLDFNLLAEMMGADKRVGKTHLNPIHKSGRGAGGHCFIKDFSAFRSLYTKVCDNFTGNALLNSAEEYNKFLLKNSGKDLDLLKGVYDSNE